MARVRVPIYKTPGKCAVIETEPRAELGVNVYYNGQLLDPRQILNFYAGGKTVIKSGSRPGSGGVVIQPPSQGDLTTDDVIEGSRKYFTDLRAQQAVGDIVDGTDDITLLYTAFNTIVGLLRTTGVQPGIYGDSSHVPRLTIDANGRITNVSLVPIALRTDIALLTEAGDYLCTESGDHLTGMIFTD